MFSNAENSWGFVDVLQIIHSMFYFILFYFIFFFIFFFFADECKYINGYSLRFKSHDNNSSNDQNLFFFLIWKQTAQKSSRKGK